MSAVAATNPAPLPLVPQFDDVLCENGRELVRGEVRTLQVNVGKLCNMACHHYHVEAGPRRTERMSRAVAERVVEMLRRPPMIARDESEEGS